MKKRNKKLNIQVRKKLIIKAKIQNKKQRLMKNKRMKSLKIKIKMKMIKRIVFITRISFIELYRYI